MNDDALVYVVDDDLGMRTALDTLLRSVGYGVQTFASVEEFAQAAEPVAPACLILDVRLKGRSGLEFQRECARLGRNLPIIFVTGHGDVPMSVAAMKAGAVEFLQKPFREQDMLDAVGEAIATARRRRDEALALAGIRERHATLTPREREVMDLVASGLMNKQVADRLGLSEVTVKVHRGQIMQKLQIRTLAELVRIPDEIARQGFRD